MTTIGRILMVEDDPKDTKLTMSALEEYNLSNEVVVATDGEEALDYLYWRGKFQRRTSENPAVLLLDLKLPKVDGLEVLQQIKSDERLKMIPVVVLTSAREERDMAASYKLGVERVRGQTGRFSRVRQRHQRTRSLLGNYQRAATGKHKEEMTNHRLQKS
jgi:CheY-like chemotaxis protein